MLLRPSIDVAKSKCESASNHCAGLSLYGVWAGTCHETFEVARQFFFYEMKRTIFVTGRGNGCLPFGRAGLGAVEADPFSINRTIFVFVFILIDFSSRFGLFRLIMWRLLYGRGRVEPLGFVTMTCDDRNLICVVAC